MVSTKVSLGALIRIQSEKFQVLIDSQIGLVIRPLAQINCPAVLALGASVKFYMGLVQVNSVFLFLVSHSSWSRELYAYQFPTHSDMATGKIQ